MVFAFLAFSVMPSGGCPSDETKGNTDQEIADRLGYPLVTFSQLPPGLPDEPHVIPLADYPDSRCFLYVRYGSATQQPSRLEIMVVISPDQRERTDENWKCLDDPTVNFVTTCDKTIVYSGKRYRVVLNSQYSLAETQNLTAFLTIS